jgi:hypothetical protein
MVYGKLSWFAHGEQTSPQLEPIKNSTLKIENWPSQ